MMPKYSNSECRIQRNEDIYNALKNVESIDSDEFNPRLDLLSAGKTGISGLSTHKPHMNSEVKDKFYNKLQEKGVY